LNQAVNRCTKSASTAKELLAHRNQRLGPAGGEIEAAQQFLAARLGRRVQFRHRGIAGFRPPSLDRRLEPRVIRPEARRQRLEKGDARARGQGGVARQNLARQRDAGGLATTRQQFLAKFD
jgi:hypothetical protein